MSGAPSRIVGLVRCPGVAGGPCRNWIPVREERCDDCLQLRWGVTPLPATRTGRDRAGVVEKTENRGGWSE